MNQLFFQCLVKYTHHPFELIIIDNASNDGSAEFFESKGVKVIRNEGNYSYPFCQNQGIREAKYDYLAFLNNDIIVVPDWDKKLIEAMEVNGLLAITGCGIERSETPESTLRYARRWKAIKNVLSLLSLNFYMLKFMHKIMYGNWYKFAEKRFLQFGTKVVEGFVGNTVLFHRKIIEKVGLWDERIQAADFDLYLRCKKRSIEQGDMKAMQISLAVFNHHFIRLTVKSKPPVFADQNQMIKLEDKWTAEELKKYMKDNVFT